MQSKKYVIMGDPVPLARARLTVRRVWDSQKQQKLIDGITLKEQHDDDFLFSGPLHLDINFFFKIPDSYSQKKRDSTIGNYHYFKPDLSNLIKYYEDIATGIIYHDDCIISKITTTKTYDINARTEFTIMELNGQENS